MEQKSKGPILFYGGEFSCFSNFSAFAVEWDGELWMTSEHAYQAAKFSDPKIRQEIKEARSAHNVKIIGGKYKEKQRNDWFDVNLKIMEEIVRAKLSQHEYIQEKLLASDDRELIEALPYDSYWGWGPNKDGENNLGKIWMKLRNELKNT